VIRSESVLRLIVRLLFVAEYCPNGWRCYNSYCYRVYDNKDKMENARARCKSTELMESDLVSISDEQENTFVKSLLSVHSVNLFGRNNTNNNNNNNNIITCFAKGERSLVSEKIHSRLACCNQIVKCTSSSSFRRKLHQSPFFSLFRVFGKEF